MRFSTRRRLAAATIFVAQGATQMAFEPAAFAQASPADAQTTAPHSGTTSGTSSGTTQQALAQSLFDQAKKLMADAHYPEACAKFADSNRLAPGTGTLLNLATCHIKIGKLATAWVELNNAADGDRREGNAQRLSWIQTQISALDPQLDYLTVNVPTPMTDLVVQLDGVKIDSVAWGTMAPVDPGVHLVQASAPGMQSWTKKITMGATSDKQVVDVPQLAPPVAAATAIANPPEKQADQSSSQDRPVDKTKRTVAYVLGGTAVVGLGVGTIFGIKTFSDWSDRNDNCPGGRCNQTAVDDYSSAKTAAIVSNISFGVAVVAAAAGTYLFLTSKPPRSAASTGGITSVAIGGAPLVGGGVASLSARF